MKVNTMTKLTIFSLTLLFVCSCKTPSVEPQRRAVVSFQFNYGSKEEIKEFFENIETYRNPAQREFFIRDVLSIFGKCRVHNYDLMNVSRISEAQDLPAIECDDLVGFFPESWAVDITPWGRELKKFGEDECR